MSNGETPIGSHDSSWVLVLMTMTSRVDCKIAEICSSDSVITKGLNSLQCYAVVRQTFLDILDISTTKHYGIYKSLTDSTM